MHDGLMNYIGGKWTEASSQETFPTTNPATEEVIALAPRSTAADVDRAVQAARSAYKAWRLTPAPRRGEILFRAAHLLSEHKEDLARLMTQELGKILAETRGEMTLKSAGDVL